MNYEQHKGAVLSSDSISDKMKDALRIFDEMDCVDALKYSRTLFELMKKRVGEMAE